MATSLPWRVLDADGSFIAACKRPEDAASVAALAEGRAVSWERHVIVWTEGAEPFAARASRDGAGAAMIDRRDLYRAAVDRHMSDPAHAGQAAGPVHKEAQRRARKAARNLDISKHAP